MAALKSRIQSLFIAPESSFGSPDATTGLIDISGLTFKAAEFDSGTGRFDQLSARMAEKTTASSEFYEHAHEVEKWCAASDTLMYSGKVTATFDMRLGGSFTAFGDYSTVPLFAAMASGMCRSTPGGASETPAGGSTANRFTPTTAATYVDGGIIRATVAGRAEYSYVTMVDAGTPLIHHTPAMSASIAAQTVHWMDGFYAAAAGTLGATVAMVLDGDGTRFVCVGATAESIRIRPEGRMGKVEITLDVPLAIEDHAASLLTYPASVVDNKEADLADGQIAHMNQAFVVVGDADTAGVTAPAEDGRTVLNTEPWEVSITNSVAYVGQTHTAIGYASREVVDSKIEATVTLMEPSTTIAADYPEVRRTLMLGMSACGASDGAGNGFAICIPSAVLRSDPNLYDASGDLVSQKLVYGAGRNDLNDSSTLPAGAPFIIAAGL